MVKETSYCNDTVYKFYVFVNKDRKVWKKLRKENIGKNTDLVRSYFPKQNLLDADIHRGDCCCKDKTISYTI